MKYHKYAELFPLMDAEDLASLATDIKKNGQRAPITLLGGEIIDGRNRWLACEKLGIKPKTREFDGDNPLSFVLSANLHRRHLTESQRAMVAANLETMSHGGSRKNQDASVHLDPKITREEVAKTLQVSPRSVASAAAVVKNGTKSQVNSVRDGKKTVSAVVKEIKAKEEKKIARDSTGYPIPEKIFPLWERRDEVKGILQEISKARCAVNEAHGNEDILYRQVNLNSVLEKLNHAYTEMQTAMPYAVCTTCQGQVAKTCTLCKGRGFISKHLYDRCVPEELKAVRNKSCEK